MNDNADDSWDDVTEPRFRPQGARIVVVDDEAASLGVSILPKPFSLEHLASAVLLNLLASSQASERRGGGAFEATS